MQTIQQLIDKFISDSEETINNFRKLKSLSENQINWKPSSESWSIAECINHLIVTNTLYLNELEKQLSQKKIKADCSEVKVKHKFLAKFIIKSVDPVNLKKVKTFTVFNPTKSTFTIEVIDEYLSLQSHFIKVVKSSNDFNLNEYIMSSPAVKIIKENFCDVLEIVRLHDKRHFNQANRILNHLNFPKN